MACTPAGHLLVSADRHLRTRFNDVMETDDTRSGARTAAHVLLTFLDLPPTHSFPANNSRSIMHIQRARPDALDAIQDLLSTFDLPYSDLTRSHLEHFFVCRNGDGIVGVGGVELFGTVGLLRSLAVRPAHRDSGIGGHLTEKIEQYARQRGAEEMYLLTTTASDYFDRHGYEIVRRDQLPEAIQQTEEAGQLCPSSATCMRKALAGSASKRM